MPWHPCKSVGLVDAPALPGPSTNASPANASAAIDVADNTLLLQMGVPPAKPEGIAAMRKTYIAHAR